MKYNILITGVSGFVGEEISHYFSDKSKYTGDDWSLTQFDEKRLEVLSFTTIHDPENCPPEIIMTYDIFIKIICQED